MDSLVLAQAIGFLGYSLCAFSPRFQARRHILLCEAVGAVLVAAQWYMLEAPIAVFSNLIAAYAAFVGVLMIRLPKLATTQILSYPMLLGAAIICYDGSMAYFVAILSSVTFVSAKLLTDIFWLRSLSLLAGVLWVAFAVLALSVPSFIFGLIYSFGHASQLYTLVKSRRSERAQTHELLPSPITVSDR